MQSPAVLLIAVAGLLLSSRFAPMASAQIGYVLKSQGEFNYHRYDYGPDRKSGDYGSPPDNRATMDIRRLELANYFYIQPSLFVEAEIEFEHGGTGSALELEYEEFGEYEFEGEKGGEVVLESFHVTKSFSNALNLRAGLFTVPVGLTNGRAVPTDFFTTDRPESELALIPSTWNETGLLGFGRAGAFDYRLGIVNGLDATGFTSEFWVVEGHQKKFELVNATALAGVARLEYYGPLGTTLGASIYHGNSTPNRPKKDMEGIDGYVTITDAHAILRQGGLIFRGLLLYGHLQNADLISEKNSRLSRNLQVPRTPVAAGALAYYGEIGYDVISLFRRDAPHALYPFFRYEYYNTMYEVDPGIFADPRFNRDVFTAGLNFVIKPAFVIKADYSHRILGDGQYNDENTIGLSLGYSGTFLDTRAH
jgi:hypothetical protein